MTLPFVPDSIFCVGPPALLSIFRSPSERNVLLDDPSCYALDQFTPIHPPWLVLGGAATTFSASRQRYSFPDEQPTTVTSDIAQPDHIAVPLGFLAENRKERAVWWLLAAAIWLDDRAMS
ncbi:hypothetical protein NMY22_g17756 [Coprinellus aureogranulatus]|nr:hypothetical protein NMY22_g17756 [Coprinellus aureogranulatus]